MRYGKTAALTGNLLFPKGNAETVGFLLDRKSTRLNSSHH